MPAKHEKSSADEHKRTDESSESSTEKPCCKPCDSGCEKPCCAVSKCDYYSPFEIACKFGPAVVTIESHLYLTAVAPPGPVTPADLRTYIWRGSGSLIGNGLILTSSFMALAPPTALVGNYRYPYLNGQVLGVVPADLAQASRILVTVHNLNGREKPHRKKANGHSVTYEASVVMVDGSGGTAVLRIDRCREFNRCRPPIKSCHPVLCIGESKKAKPGDIAYVMGEIASDHLGPFLGSYRGVTEGVIVNQQTGMPNGTLLPEMVAVSLNVSGFVVGAPILNRFGQIIAVQTTTMADGILPTGAASSWSLIFGDARPFQGAEIVLGVSEFFFRGPVKSIMCIDREGRKGDRLRRHLETVADYAIGDFYRFVKGYAGIAYQVANGSDLVTYWRSPALPTQARNVLLNADGSLYNGPNCGTLVGIRVMGTAGAALPVSVQIPGTAPPAPFNPTDSQNSNFMVTLPFDYILVSIGNCPLGIKYPQILPSLQTWQLLPGERVSFTARKPNNVAGVAAADNLNKYVSVTGTLLDTPAVMDYLWAIVGQFPDLANPQNPAPVIPAIHNPIIPTLTFYPCF